MLLKIIDRMLLAILVLIGMGAVASPQLEALKDNWAEEKLGKLPATREEWEAWKEGDVESLKAMVTLADTMNPSLVTRFVESPKADKVVVAIGGSGQTLDSIWRTQGEFFAAHGYAVLLVENPPDDIARICLERGTSWLAYGTAALLPRIRELRLRFPNGILWSGFSLGTELMMSTANLDNAPGDKFIYNDFLCRSKERLLVMDQEPNGLRNITPGYFVCRDFPERMLALSDHPILFTEGGLDRDFAIVKSIFPQNITVYHQPRYANVERFLDENLPRHLSLMEYFTLCNVDPTNHYYKQDLVDAWLDKLEEKLQNIDADLPDWKTLRSRLNKRER